MNAMNSKDAITSLDPDHLSPKDLYSFMVQAIVPRPIALVSTISKTGVGNLAPFSFFNGVASNPPAVMIAVTPKRDGSPKDTLRNIYETGQFVINSVNEWIADPMNQCSADYPYGVDEMQKVGLTALPSLKVRPPRVKEAGIHLECELYKTLEVGDGSPGSSILVVGRIVMMHVWSSLFENHQISIEALKPLSRLGGLSYGRVSETFDLPRPKQPEEATRD